MRLLLLHQSHLFTCLSLFRLILQFLFDKTLVPTTFEEMPLGPVLFTLMLLVLHPVWRGEKKHTHKKENLQANTWPSPEVDESHLSRLLNQCVSVRLYSLDISLLCKRESIPLLPEPRSLTLSNHGSAERRMMDGPH